MTIIVAVERGWIDRAEALRRLHRMLDLLEGSPGAEICRVRFETHLDEAGNRSGGKLYVIVRRQACEPVAQATDTLSASVSERTPRR